MEKRKQKKVTVLHIIDSLPREGAEMLLYDLIQRGDRQRFSFRVCSLTRGGGVADLLAKIKIPVFILGRSSFWDWSSFRRLVRLIKDQRPDIVHTHLFSSHLWGRMAARLAGRMPIFSTEHNMSDWKSPWHRIADCLSSQFTERIIAVSLPVKESLVSVCDISPSKITVIENGLNFDRLRFQVNRKQKLKELNLPDNCQLVGTAAALTPKKGHRYLLEEAERIISRRENLYFLLLGEGELKDKIQTDIQRPGLRNRVLLLGSRPDALEIISLLDVFVLSSIREGLSLALLEAMALGKAVVVSAVGGSEQVVENEVSGLLVPPADGLALAEAVERVIDYPEFGRRLGEAARNQILTRYDLAETVRCYENLYYQSLGRSRP